MNGGRPGVACFSFDFFLVPCFSLHPPYTSAGREINCRRAQLILGEINILEEEPEEREDKERTKRGQREEKERRKAREKSQRVHSLSSLYHHLASLIRFHLMSFHAI